MFDKDFGIAQNADRAVQRRPAPLGVPHDSALHAGGRLRHRLVAARLQRAAVHRRTCATSQARSTRPRNSTAPADGPSSRRITWPLIWPVTVLVFTIQLILQFKIFDQVYLFASLGGRFDPTMVMVQYIYKQAFQMNKGGLAAAASVVLFLLIVVLSVLQYQLLRARGRAMSASRRHRTRASRAPPPRGGSRGSAALRRVGLVITLATADRRGHLGVPALLGADYDVQAGVRYRSAGRSTLAGAFHVRELRPRPAARRRSASGT